MWKEFCICCSGSTGSSHGMETTHGSGAYSAPFEPPRDAVVIEPLPSVESLTASAAQHRTTPTAQSNGSSAQQAATAAATVPPPSGPAAQPLTNAKPSGGRPQQQPPVARQDWTAFHEQQDPPPVLPSSEPPASVPPPSTHPQQNLPTPSPKKNTTRAAEMKNPPPAPLHIDTSIVPEPISTTAKFAEWEEKSAKAQKVTIEELLGIPEDQRADLVYQYLTPEQIIDRKGQLAQLQQLKGLSVSDTAGSSDVESSNRPVPSPIVIEKEVSEEHPTAEEFEDHDRKRREFLDLTDLEIVNMPLAHLESFYEHLTADEIIDATKKLDNLKKAVKEGSLKSEKPKLARVSTDFMRTLRPTVSLRSENGEFIDDDYVPDDTTAIDVRDILLQASDDEVMSLSDGVLRKLEPLLSINEMEDLRERRFLIEAARKAKALAESESYAGEE